MNIDRKYLLLLSLSALLLFAAGFGSVPPAVKLAAGLPCLFLVLFTGVRMYRNGLYVKGLMENLYEMLNQNLIALFEEVTEGQDPAWTREILYEKKPGKGNPLAFFKTLRGLLNRQVALFKNKNRYIRELNDKILFSKKQLEAVFDILDDGLCIVDSDMRIFRLNRPFAEYCGAEIKSLLNQPSHQVFPGAQKAHLDNYVRKTFETGERACDVKFDTNAADGKLFFTFGTFPICKDSSVEYVVEHFRNVTNERKINEQLMRSVNLATIGTMITGIAHDMNNPLAGISGCAQNMIAMPDTFGLNAKGRDRIQDMLECSKRAELILRDLLDLSRKKESQFIIMNIMPVIEKSLKSIHVQGFDRIRTEVSVAAGTSPIVNCDPARLTQVFINLFMNASLSLLEKAETESKSGNDFTPRLDVQVRRDGTFLSVSVIDNGLGIPQDKIPSIFDPFYTTRPPGQGTGLGLSICSKIMLEHNGRIYAESGEGKTILTVELPLPRMG
jgi:two-component system NtrC family sensor kinase